MGGWYSIDKDGPPPDGERVVVVSAVTEWITEWKPALAYAGVFPVTHYRRVERPYPRVSAACKQDAYEAQKLRQRKVVCRINGDIDKAS